MSEWWTYRLSSFLLFAPETYYRLFESYNAAFWPLQIAAFVVAIGLVLLILRGAPHAGRLVAIVLAFAWAWVAWQFHWQRYAAINWAAAYIAAAFAVQAALLLAAAVGGALDYRSGCTSLRACIGLAVFIFAVAVQPLVSLSLGRAWMQLEVVGFAPDPTAVATLGLLLAADRIRWWLAVTPIAWCIATGFTLWAMKAPEAIVTPLAAAVALLAAVANRRRR